MATITDATEDFGLNVSFEGDSTNGWVAKMPYPVQQGPGVITVFEGPNRPTVEEALWAMVDRIALEAAEYREVKQMAGTA